LAIACVVNRARLRALSHAHTGFQSTVYKLRDLLEEDDTIKLCSPEDMLRAEETMRSTFMS
jgi:hypothetical protein